MPAASQPRSARSAAPLPRIGSSSGPSTRNPYGPGLSWPLPADASCARAARGFAREAWEAFRLPAELLDDTVLAVSELAANAWRHALGGEPRPGPARAGWTLPELWAYPRGAGASAEMVCGVFDSSVDTWPSAHPGPPDLLAAGAPSALPPNVIDAGVIDAGVIDADEAGSGRGLAIVRALSDAAGCRRTRSRLAADSVAGKVAWFSMRIPAAAPESPAAGITPVQAARTLARLLTARGIAAVSRHRGPARSTVSTAAGMTVCCQDGAFEGPGGRRGFPDLADVLEDIVWRHEERRCAGREG